MTTVTISIVEFATARLDEDEAAAVAARDAHQGLYATEGDADWYNSDDELISTQPHGIIIISGPYGFLGHETAEHIVRHDPARVLRDVAAKRQLLNQAAAMRDLASDTEAWFLLGLADNIERQLVASYDDHPDYDESWRPGAPD